jgi:hypothetical protein
MQNNKNLWVALVVVAIIAVGGYFFPQVTGLLGASTPGTRFPHGITIGLPSNSPTNYALIQSTTCNLQANFSITASTTRSVPCAVSSAVSGDLILVLMPATTTLAAQYLVLGATASSTAGQVDVSLYNATGGSAVPAATATFGSSTPIMLFRAQ